MSECTCRIITKITENAIDYCPMHKAAPTLLEAAEAVMKTVYKADQKANQLNGIPVTTFDILGAAIAEAKGEGNG